MNNFQKDKTTYCVSSFIDRGGPMCMTFVGNSCYAPVKLLNVKLLNLHPHERIYKHVLIIY